MTITRQQLEETLATKGYLHFEHKTLKNADGTPVRARANGKIKVWIRDPAMFKLPCKYGLKTCFYIDNFEECNNDDWEIC